MRAIESQPYVVAAAQEGVDYSGKLSFGHSVVGLKGSSVRSDSGTLICRDSFGGGNSCSI